MLPPASPMAVATRPSMPGRWSISTRRMIEYCAETEGIRAEDAHASGGSVAAWVWTARCAAGVGRRAGDDHVDPRHDDRQRGDRDARARPRRVAVVDPVGLDGLPAGAGDRDPADRLVDGALRRPAHVDALRRAVPGRLGAVRARLEHRVADRLPRPAGLRRRHDHADRPGDPGAGRGAAADGPGHERDRRADAAGPDPRAGDRRPDRRQLLVALDLLRQRPGGRSSRWRWPARILPRRGGRGRARGAGRARACCCSRPGWRCSSTGCRRSGSQGGLEGLARARRRGRRARCCSRCSCCTPCARPGGR